ncbi:MAG: hypothetical protein HQK51_03820 [Oligoflexia bacterium]|nr:hypothetical protein [Oligoflexia bacterium]
MQQTFLVFIAIWTLFFSNTGHGYNNECTDGVIEELQGTELVRYCGGYIQFRLTPTAGWEFADQYRLRSDGTGGSKSKKTLKRSERTFIRWEIGRALGIAEMDEKGYERAIDGVLSSEYSSTAIDNPFNKKKEIASAIMKGNGEYKLAITRKEESLQQRAKILMNQQSAERRKRKSAEYLEEMKLDELRKKNIAIQLADNKRIEEAQERVGKQESKITALQKQMTAESSELQQLEKELAREKHLEGGSSQAVAARAKLKRKRDMVKEFSQKVAVLRDNVGAAEEELKRLKQAEQTARKIQHDRKSGPPALLVTSERRPQVSTSASAASAVSAAAPPVQASLEAATSDAKNDVRIMKNAEGRWSILSTNPREVEKQLVLLAESFSVDIRGKIPKICCKDQQCVAEINSIIPPRLLSVLGKRVSVDGPNCFNAALYYKDILPILSYYPQVGLNHVLQESGLCDKVSGKPRPGDICFVDDRRGNYSHAFVHVSDKIIFEKMDTTIDSEYMFKGAENLQGFADKDRYTMTYYRCIGVKDFLKKNPRVKAEFDKIVKGLDEIDCTQTWVQPIDFDSTALFSEIPKVSAELLGYDMKLIRKLDKEEVVDPLAKFRNALNELFSLEDEEEENPDRKRAKEIAKVFDPLSSPGTSSVKENLIDHGGEIFPESAEKALQDEKVINKLKNEMKGHYEAKAIALAQYNLFGKLTSDMVSPCEEKKASKVESKIVPKIVVTEEEKKSKEPQK